MQKSPAEAVGYPFSQLGFEEENASPDPHSYWLDSRLYCMSTGYTFSKVPVGKQDLDHPLQKLHENQTWI